MTDTIQLTALETFLQVHSTIKYIPPSSPEYQSARRVWNSSRRDNPLAIVQPQSPSDVASLIRFTKSQSLPFTLRSGGHNLEGRSIVDGALLIDLRALNAVTIAPDRKSATVQGGILQGELANRLWAEGLATPTGTVPSVGYVGWAAYGGYGPFSSHWGLGVDQILGATVINPDGEIIAADEALLQGIRGAGGLFGVIVDLTIKVYPLTTLLSGAILYDSTNITKTFITFNAAYRALLDEDPLPHNSPPSAGRLLAAIFVWSGSDTTTGNTWATKIAALAPCLANTVSETTIPSLLASTGALIPITAYGAPTETVGEYLDSMPPDPGTMFSIHQLRGPSAMTQKHSTVFAAREPHYMLEFLGYAVEETLSADAMEWARADPMTILPTVYVSLYNTAAISSDELLRRVYGHKAGVAWSTDISTKLSIDHDIVIIVQNG
ncbi:FAD-binding oxidoreductase [Aspergillus novofumigatus IBT 16806]|uniref:D-lactate dehydrogenase n=1 Tax=Aspergillus novofumigatus (strain IBT 16806) TaxID=1392255 RepID=A0A2I1CBL6_ASPN1|nr:D-lactate dehydrogenase [Aspergillus novofumigatus IBT 16806]PKX94981.1 D-lactate dehydrogenase [Aspergillus novofumigatus IBT 16806]